MGGGGGGGGGGACLFVVVAVVAVSPLWGCWSRISCHNIPTHNHIRGQFCFTVVLTLTLVTAIRKL